MGLYIYIYIIIYIFILYNQERLKATYPVPKPKGWAEIHHEIHESPPRASPRGRERYTKSTDARVAKDIGLNSTCSGWRWLRAEVLP